MYWGGEVYLHAFLSSVLDGGISFTTLLVYPQGKSPWYPLDRRLGGPHSRSGDAVMKRKKKNN
jgi:hypothetical protein